MELLDFVETLKELHNILMLEKYSNFIFATGIWQIILFLSIIVIKIIKNY